MHAILLVLQILIGAGLIGLVLLQQGRGADAGASFGGGGGAGSLFGARGPASFLAKMTAGFAAAFFINSLSLAYLSTLSVERRSVVEQVHLPDTPATGRDTESSVPVAPETAPPNSVMPANSPEAGSASPASAGGSSSGSAVAPAASEQSGGASTSGSGAAPPAGGDGKAN